MLAAWYERPGPAAEVLEVGELADPSPGPGEVRVRLAFSGTNPGDTKKRSDWVGYGMPYASREARPDFDFWPMLFANLTIRLLGSDDFPAAAKQQATADLTAAAQQGALRMPVDDRLPLDASPKRTTASPPEHTSACCWRSRPRPDLSPSPPGLCHL